MENLTIFNQSSRTVKSHTTVVADNTTAAVSIWQTRDDVSVTALTDVFGVSREHTFVVRLTILREDFLREGIELIAIGLEAVFHHANTAARENAAL